MTIRGSRLRALAATSLIAVACSSAPGDVGPVAQVGGPVATASATPSADPVEVAAAERTEPTPQDWTVPAPITVEYVTRVLTEIERYRGNFDRWLIDSDPFEQAPEAIEADFLRIFHLLIGRNLMQKVLDDYADSGGDSRFARRPFGQDRPVAVELLLADSDCVLMSVDWDTSETLLPEGHERVREFVALVDSPASQVHLNPTGWVIAYQGPLEDLDPGDVDIEVRREGQLCAS